MGAGAIFVRRAVALNTVSRSKHPAAAAKNLPSGREILCVRPQDDCAALSGMAGYASAITRSETFLSRAAVIAMPIVAIVGNIIASPKVT